MDFQGLFDTADTDPTAGASANPLSGEGRFSLQLQRPHAELTIIDVAGPLDLATTPRFDELAHTRLASATPRLILDLSEVTFLSVSGIDALLGIEHKARILGKYLTLVTGAHSVDRPLQALGMTTRFSYGDRPVSNPDPESDHAGVSLTSLDSAAVEHELQGA